MKKIITLILVIIIFSSQVYAAQLESPKISTTGNINQSLFAYNADRLISLVIPQNASTLPNLSKYPNLTSISVDDGNLYYTAVDGILYDKNMTTLICYPQCKKDKTFTVPSGVQYITSGAFFENSYITSVLLPSTLKNIGANPFAKCKKLDKLGITDSNSYFSVEDGILYNNTKTILYACPTVKSAVFIPDGVTQISYSAFSGCVKLREITLPQSLSKIESMAFNGCTALTDLYIPKNLKELNISCFTNCMNLVNFETDKSDYFKAVDGILYSADMIDLICCPKGKGGIVTLPNGVINILNGAFDNCTKITRILLPDSIEYISRAFLNCLSLKNIELPKTQAIIEYGAFAGCSGLKWVYIPNNIVIIQNGAFNKSNPIILCDEDSFAEIYAEENHLSYQYKYEIAVNGKTIHIVNQPFEQNNEIYLPLSEIVEILGGSCFWDYGFNSFGTELNGNSVQFTETTAEKKIMNQTEIINLFGNSTYKNNELYISITEYAKIFDIDIIKNGYRIEITS